MTKDYKTECLQILQTSGITNKYKGKKKEQQKEEEKKHTAQRNKK